MSIDFLVDVFTENPGAEAVVWQGRVYSYRWLLNRLAHWRAELAQQCIAPGSVVALEADFSPNAIALLLALIERNCIVVPLTPSVEAKKPEFLEIAQAETVITLDEADHAAVRRFSDAAQHSLYHQLRRLNHAGLVLFSSGSTGKSKGIVHDFTRLLQKYRTRRHNLRTLTFLLFDHIGGVDTLFYSLSNGSCIVTVADRSPDAVCAAVEAHRVEVLPVSPTFLNLLILSEAYTRHNLSSLKYITYGAEVMPQAVLDRCVELFPGVTVLQKYGTTEVGTLRSKSERSNSLWVKMGGDGFDIRVVDGMLQIKAQSAMLGYLNAPNPFTEDGWFITGDEVQVKGEYLKILGRASEIINVGGEKVYPAEVENVIQQMDNVADATVFGRPSPITGSMVCANVRLLQPEEPKAFRRRLKVFCSERLQSYKVPVKVKIVRDDQHSSRFKKMRLNTV
ncbi:MAG: long-chain fatty acid--CoA ligase [Chloroflexi bacterium]|nr:MAG: long-chain fatty acid--CoA ligase [Chloroflexota bacterium]